MSAPSPYSIDQSVFVVVQDQRPAVERKVSSGDPWRTWDYTADRTDNQASLALGRNLSDTIQRKRMAREASNGLPTSPISANTLVVRINLISWYGRLQNPPPVSGAVVSVLNPGHPLVGEGLCKFGSVLEHQGRRIDLGVSEGQISASWPRASNPSIPKEGNYLSGAAVTEAMASFFKSFEASAATNQIFSSH